MEEPLIRAGLNSIRADIDQMIAELGSLEDFIEAEQTNTIHMDAAASIRQTVDTMRAAILLSDNGLFSGALALCRTGLEQALGNLLNLREPNLLWYYTFATKEDAVSWVETTSATLSSSSDIALIGKPTKCDYDGETFCVPVVLRNLLTTSDGKSKSPFPGARLLAVIDRHRHELSTGGETFRGLLYPYIGDRKAVIDQKHHYRHHFTRRSLINAIRFHGLLEHPDLEQLDRHYNYLSLFSHGTSDTDQYLYLRGHDRSRVDSITRTLIALYVYCILEVETNSFTTFIELSEGVRLKPMQSMSISAQRGSNRREWLGFISADSHPLDIYREKSYRSDLKLADILGKADVEDGYMRSDDREFFDTNFLTRLNEALSPSRNIMSGDSYVPPELR